MTASALLILRAETPLHAGAGQATGVVDLPIQREAHTGWPCVFGSGVKGALRQHASRQQCPDIDVLFGPESSRASDHAGALSVGDARLLLLPVRSLTSHFRWVTCPALLARFGRDSARLGVAAHAMANTPVVGPDEALASHPGDLYIEEYRLNCKPVAVELVERLAGLFPAEEQAAFRAQFTVVHDDTFAHLCRTATPVAAHVKLNDQKAVVKGALWYEETLPPDTVLYVALIAEAQRKAAAERARRLTDAEVLQTLDTGALRKRPWLQLGGNETVGMGYCHVQLLPGA